MMDRLIFLIIFLNVIVSFIGFANPKFFAKYKFTVSGINQGQYYRYFTSGFLHVGITHLFFNMLTFYFFAPIVAISFDNPQFLLIYIGGLFLGGWMSYRLNQENKSYSAVGASGAVVGILFTSIVLRPDLELFIFFFPIPIKAYVFAIFYIIYTVLGMKNKTDSIGHSAHFGGAIGSLGVALLLKPEILDYSSKSLLLILGSLVLGALIVKFSPKKFR